MRPAAFVLAIISLAGALEASAQHHRNDRGVELTARLVGQGFVLALLSGDVAGASSLAAAPFNFDGSVVDRAPDVRSELQRLVDSGRLAGFRLLRVEAMPAEEAIRRYGEPPARVRSIATRDDMVVLARLNRGGIAIFLRRIEGLWRIVGATD